MIAKVYLYDTCHTIQKVVWTVNDEEIDQHGLGGKFSEVSVDSPCLTIHNVNCCDVGSYKITATNAVGSTTSDAIVLSKPIIYSISLSRLINGKNMNYSNTFPDRHIIKLYLSRKTYQAHIIHSQKTFLLTNKRTILF